MAYPGRVDFAGRHVGDIGLEAHRHVFGAGRRAAQMHRDLAGHDHLAQHIAGQAFFRRGAAAAAPGKQPVGRDGNGLGRFFPRRQGIALPAAGQKFQPCHRLLAVKHLHALYDLALPASGIGPQAVNGVGAHRRVGFLQTVSGIGCRQAGSFGRTGFIGGQAGKGYAGFIQHRHLHTSQRGCLPCHRCIQLDTACWHSKTPPCTTVCRGAGRCKHKKPEGCCTFGLLKYLIKIRPCWQSRTARSSRGR